MKSNNLSKPLSYAWYRYEEIVLKKLSATGFDLTSEKFFEKTICEKIAQTNNGFKHLVGVSNSCKYLGML